MIRILICDDEGIVQESLKFIIQKSFKDECELAVAKNGRTAIELADVFRPDEVLMDIQMPGINGIEAMRSIRSKYENIVFIVLTAYDKIEYTQSSIDIGVLAYLTKPIKRNELIKTLQKAMVIVEKQKEKASYDLEMQEKLEFVEPIIENGFVYSIILEAGISEDTFFRYRELLGIQEEHGYVMMIECGDDFSKGEMSNAVGSGIKLQKRFMVFREIVKGAVSGIVGALIANRVAVLIPCHEKDTAYEERVKIIDNVRCMIQDLERQIGLKFKVGIGSVKPWKHMFQSYREAMETLQQGIGKVAAAKKAVEDAEQGLSQVPASVTASWSGVKNVQITWKESSGAASYEVYRSNAASKGYQRIAAGVKTTSYTDKNATPGKNVYYKVIAENSAGKSDYSKEAFAYVLKAPAKLKAKAAKGKVTISFGKSAQASGYEIYRSAKKNGKYKKAATLTSQKKVKKVLKTKRGTYYFKVRAYKKVGKKKVYTAYTKIVKAKVK